jgi:hypothetical protein
MSRNKSALDGMLAFVGHEMSTFWSLQTDPAPEEAEDRDSAAKAERESFFWRTERRQPAW